MCKHGGGALEREDATPPPFDTHVRCCLSVCRRREKKKKDGFFAVVPLFPSFSPFLKRLPRARREPRISCERQLPLGRRSIFDGIIFSQERKRGNPKKILWRDDAAPTEKDGSCEEKEGTGGCLKRHSYPTPHDRPPPFSSSFRCRRHHYRHPHNRCCLIVAVVVFRSTYVGSTRKDGISVRFALREEGEQSPLASSVPPLPPPPSPHRRC